MVKTHSLSAPQLPLQAVSSGADVISNQGAHEIDSAGPRVSTHPPEFDKPNLLLSWVLGNPQMAITGIPPPKTECRFLLVGSFPAPNAVLVISSPSSPSPLPRVERSARTSGPRRKQENPGCSSNRGFCREACSITSSGRRGHPSIPPRGQRLRRRPAARGSYCRRPSATTETRTRRRQRIQGDRTLGL
jgi:hypothetical protein